MMTAPLHLELSVARHSIHRAKVGLRAFQSYRAKVASGRVVPPVSFDGLLCRQRPDQLEELRARGERSGTIAGFARAGCPGAARHPGRQETRGPRVPLERRGPPAFAAQSR